MIAINLVNAVERVEANTGQTPEQVLVDGGYTMKNSNIEAMAERGIDLNGPVTENNNEASFKQRGIQPEFYPDKFRYDEATDTFRCPADKVLKPSRPLRCEGRIEYSYRASATDCRCMSIPRPMLSQELSTHGGAKRRFCRRSQPSEPRWQTEEAKQLYRTRAQIAEFPHAWIKEKFGLRRFRLRGRQKVRAEAVWACLTYNIQQWLRLSWRRSLEAAA